MYLPKKRHENMPNIIKIMYFCIRYHAIVAQLVEHWLPKPRVAGSSPVYRSP